MRGGIRQGLGLAAAILLVQGRAVADEFCDSLQEAMQAAPRQFASLKGSWDPDAEFYNTPWNIDGASGDDCDLSHDESDGYSISCDWPTGDYNDATDRAREVGAKVEACLRASGKYIANDWRDDSLNLRLSSSKGISRMFYAPSSEPAYEIAIRVSGVCMTSVRRGTERCSARVSVDLKGDER